MNVPLSCHPQTLLKRVDRALYLAKQLGRNNVQTL